MKKTLATITTLLAALTAHANILNVIRNDYSTLEFYVSQPNPGQAREVYFGITGTGLEQSLADVRSYLGIAGVNIDVLWQTYSQTVNDSFVLTPSGPVGFDGTEATYQPNEGAWLFRYDNQTPIVPPQVPDAGGVLGMMGCAMLGLWGARRVLA